MEEGKEGGQTPRLRLSAEQRDRFLEVLGQTGNRRYAARAIGVEPRLMDQRRAFDRLLDEGWEAALDQAHRRLSGADGPFDCIGGRELNVIQRGPKGRLRLVSAGERRWSKVVEERFLAMLAVSGNIAGSARSVGFSESCIWQRRRKWPEFAQRMEEVLEDAEVRLEFRMATMGNDTDQRALGEGHAPPPEGTEDARAEAEAGLRFDPDLALRFLRWREAKRQGHDRWRGSRPRTTWTFDESMELLEKKLKALGGRMERQKLAEGWSQDENGYMIPPGWVRAGGDRPPRSTARKARAKAGSARKENHDRPR